MKVKYTKGINRFIIIGPALFPVRAVSHCKVSSSIARSVYKKVSVVRGHHIYKKFWTPVIEVLPVEREEDNQHDNYAAVVIKNRDIVSHVPCSITLHVNDPALIRDPVFISELRMYTPGL